MKTLLITSIAAIALTHAARAGDWTWFPGDIGLSSPFTSSSSAVNNATTGVVTKRKVVAKRKAAPNRSVAGSKSKSTGHRITAR
jgi:hypothetical protein